MKNEIENKGKINSLLNKFSITEDRVMQRQKALEREMMFKQEKSSMKKLEKETIIKRLHNKAEFEKEQIIKEIKEKSEKLEMIKLQKVKVNEKRKEVAEQVFKQKQEVMEKFEKIMRRNKGITVSYF